MKIMQINCVYKKGSTGKIVYALHNYIQNNGDESVVCYGRGSLIKEKNIYKSCSEFYAKVNNLCSRFTGIMYGGCFFSTNTLLRIIEKEKPNIVHMHCINGYFVNIYRLISYLKDRKIKTVLTLHAEFMYTANCGHALECDKWKNGCGYCPRLKEETKSLLFDNTAFSWRKMKQAFEGFDNLLVVSVSPWLQERAEQSPMLCERKHITVMNGVDTSIFHIYPHSRLKNDLGIENKKIIFHATALFSTDKDHLKGGYYVIEMAKRFSKVDNNVIFLVAGKHEIISNLPTNIIFLGNIENQNLLAEYYSIADITLLTSKKETFSMVVAESLCCGTPVIGFEAGAPEMITIKEFSRFIPYGEIDSLFNELRESLDNTIADKNTISYFAHEKYGNDKMMKNYQAVYDEILNC